MSDNDDIDPDDPDEMKKSFVDSLSNVKINSSHLSSGAALRKHMEKRFAQEELLEKTYGPDHTKEVSRFSLNKAEQAVVDAWLEELKPELVALSPDPLGQGEPYYGAMGGGVTYNFLPTGLGTIITVTESLTGKTLNVSEALNWHFFG